MEKYLANDYEVKNLGSKEALKEYLEFRRVHDEWVVTYLNELATVGIPNEPLFIPEYCNDIEIKKNGFTLKIDDIDFDDEENSECIQETGLFLVFPHGNKLETWPTRRIAYPSICKRADDDSGIMYRFEARPNKGILPINEKAERLNRDFQLYSDSCKILLRDGKVSAVLSKEYAILPAYEVIAMLESRLAKDHPDYTFDRGSVSHEYLVVEYLLNNKEMEDTFRLRLNDNSSCNISELKAGIRFATSDVGLSKVSATVFFDTEGVRTTLDNGIFLEHKGEVTPADFAVKCEDLGILLKECEDRIEELGNMEIQDVVGVIKEIRKIYTFLPAKCAEEVEQDLKLKLPYGGTGIDVYLGLNDIVQRHTAQSDLSPTRYLNLCEQVAKLMKLPYDKIDKGEEWKKL